MCQNTKQKTADTTLLPYWTGFIYIYIFWFFDIYVQLLKKKICHFERKVEHVEYLYEYIYVGSRGRGEASLYSMGYFDTI